MKAVSQFIVIFIAMAAAFASRAAGTCSFNEITNNCQAFNPKRGLKIDTGDGTFIPNYSALDDKAPQNPKDKIMLERDRETKALTKDIKLALQTQKELQKVSDQILSPVAKAHLANRIGAFRQIIEGREPELYLVWPSHGSEIRPVHRDEYRRWYKSLPPAVKASFVRIEKQLEVHEKGELKEDQPNDASAKAVRELRRSEMQMLKKREPHFRDLVEQAKSLIVKKLTDGKPRNQWTASETALVKKIETVHSRRFTRDDESSCSGIVANAFYNPANHSILLCPQFAVFPDVAVMSVIAHELGHAIDPCNCQFGVHQLNEKKAKDFVQTHRQSDKYDHFLTSHYLEGKMSQDQSSRTAMANSFGLPAPILNLVTSHQILVPISPGTTRKDYPLNSVLQCLKDKGFRGQKDEAVVSLAEAASHLRSQVGRPDFDSTKDQQEIRNAFKEYPDCVSTFSDSQVREAMADWISGEVMGEYLKKHPLKLEGQRLALFSSLGASLCSQRLGKTDDFPLSGRETMSAASQIVRDSTTQPHPADIHRFEKITLAQPLIRKALGCAPAKPEQLACQKTPPPTSVIQGSAANGQR